MNIRKAKKSDLNTVMDLTKKLAVFEREAKSFNVSKDFFLKNILCENPKAECYLIENEEGQVVGMGELFVTLSTYAIKRDCRQIFWGVYDWNQLARGLYDKVGKPHHDTVIYSMGPDEIKEILKA